MKEKDLPRLASSNQAVAAAEREHRISSVEQTGRNRVQTARSRSGLSSSFERVLSDGRRGFPDPAQDDR
jgi:hypothetical protein